MRKPQWLTDKHAREFWDAHARKLADNGTLTDLTQTSFAILCQTFHDWRTATDGRERAKHFDNFFKLATKFGVIPHISVARAAAETQERTLDSGLAELFPSIG